MDKQKFLNTYINNITMSETVQAIDNFITCQNKSYVVAVNTDVIVKIESDKYLKEIADNADLTLADGMPLIWISKLLKKPLLEKVSGSDLINEIIKLACNKNYSIFIIGGKEGVAKQAADNIYKKYPNVKIVGTYSPKFGFEGDKVELDNINNIISKANPDILIACFGCPKQEKWIYENYKRYSAYVSICAGATVDFLAGTVKRAPKWMSKSGLEWFYRFTQDPKRLFKRYFVDDLAILPLIIKYKNGK